MRELLILALLAAAWCALHSLMIATPVTSLLKERLGAGYRLHRLAFNLVSLVTLIALVLYRASVAGEVFFAWEGLWVVPRVVLIASAVFLFAAGARHYDLQQFLGLRQLRAGQARKGLTAEGGLDTSGILGLVRHPWYLGALLAIWARDLDASVTVVNAVFSVYLVVGTILEERKLMAEFGDVYRDYRRRVPMLVPWRIGGRR